jgi:putative aminopeptidase FrvX
VNLSLLRDLCEAAGPSGREERLRDLVRPHLEATCAVVEEDVLGTLIGTRPGTGGPRLLLAAHMDEIGLMVTHIDDRGFIRFVPLGGWDARTLVAQRVMVHGREDIPGVVGTTPVHLLDEAARQKAPKLEDLAIDTGRPADQVRALVRQGDVITRTRTLEPLGDLLTGKSLDDRVGVFVMLEAMGRLEELPAEVVAAATVQEEVGLRGAKVAAARVRPDVAIAIDTCPADDGPGTPGNGPSTRLGAGTAIRLMDASAIGAPRLVELMVSVAEQENIRYQFHVSNKGGTDTQSLQLAGEGALAGCVSIPTRYVHTSVEACHPDDIAASIALVVGVARRAHELMS